MLTNCEYPAAVSDEGYLLDPTKSRVKSFPLAETVPFGRVIGTVATDGSIGQLPSANKLILSADLVTSNVTNANITVITTADGVDTTTTTAITAVTFATSHLNTFGTLLKAAIEAVDTKLTATLDTSDTNNRTMYVTHSDNAVVIISGVIVTLGGSQATASYSFYGKLRGVSVISNRQPDSNGVRQFKGGDIAGVVSQGRVIVKPIDASDINSTLYVQFIDDTNKPRGTIRTSTASGKAIAISPTTLNGSAIALAANTMELNLP